MNIQAPTVEQYIEHLKAGTNRCLVCEAEPLSGSWTDYNGQISCFRCGMTYQILGSHITEEFLKEHGLQTDQIAWRYCDAFMKWPLCRAYWRKTGRIIPFGTYLGRSPIPQTDYDAFYKWIWEHQQEIRPQYEEVFKWDILLQRYGTN